jgi:hypothetical protein
VRHFYWRLVKRSLPLFWDTLKRGDAIASVLASVFGIAGLTWVLQLIPLWVPVGAFALLFLYGLLRANYEEFERVEHKYDKERRATRALERKWANEERRRTFKNALAAASDEGERLLQIDNLTDEQGHDWAIRVGIMIALGLDQGEWRLYFSGHALAPTAIQGDSEAKQLINRRLQRLYDLVLRIDRDKLQVPSDFHSRDWVGTRPPRILVPPQAQEVLTRAKEVGEAGETALAPGLENGGGLKPISEIGTD